MGCNKGKEGVGGLQGTKWIAVQSQWESQTRRPPVNLSRDGCPKHLWLLKPKRLSDLSDSATCPSLMDLPPQKVQSQRTEAAWVIAYNLLSTVIDMWSCDHQYTRLMFKSGKLYKCSVKASLYAEELMNIACIRYYQDRRPFHSPVVLWSCQSFPPPSFLRDSGCLQNPVSPENSHELADSSWVSHTDTPRKHKRKSETQIKTDGSDFSKITFFFYDPLIVTYPDCLPLMINKWKISLIPYEFLNLFNFLCIMFSYSKQYCEEKLRQQDGKDGHTHTHRYTHDMHIAVNIWSWSQLEVKLQCWRWTKADSDRSQRSQSRSAVIGLPQPSLNPPPPKLTTVTLRSGTGGCRQFKSKVEPMPFVRQTPRGPSQWFLSFFKSYFIYTCNLYPRVL